MSRCWERLAEARDKFRETECHMLNFGLAEIRNEQRRVLLFHSCGSDEWTRLIGIFLDLYSSNSVIAIQSG